MKTKIFSLGLLILFFCILGYPLNNAYAQTMTDAQKQVLIAQLKQKLAQVEEMLSQLIAEQEANNVWCHTFNSNLGFAQSGTDEVVDLHLALMLDANSPPSAPESSYTPDDINTYYLGTSKAVVAFQKKYGITPQNGYVGPNTRAQLNKLYGCAATPSTVQTNVTTNPSTVLVTNITVSAKGSVTSIFSGNTLQMSADVLPLNATNPAVKWSVAGSNGVSISDSGLLSTINSNSTGTATVTATAADGSGVTGTEQIGLFGFGGGNGGYFPGSSVNPALTLTSIAITTPATKLSYNVGDSLDITGLAVTGTYTDNSTQVENVTSANITGFASSAANPSETLTVNYGGKTITYNVSINTPIITAAAGGGDWNNPSTWVGGVVPNLSDDVIINPGTTVSIGSGTANCNTISLMGITGGISQISISTGTLNVAGSITAAGTSSQIIFSDAGKLNIGGNFMAGTAGTFTANNSTVNFNGVGRQDIGVYNYNNLTTSNSGTKNFHGGNISGALTIGGGSAFIFGASYTKIAATVTVSSSLVSSFQGNPINFTATLTGTGATPTGTVQFIVDGVNFGNPVAVTAKGIAISNTTSTIASGSHTITANYLGDSQFYPFSSSANITVNPPLLVGIFSIKPPTKTQYYVGDTVSITGLVVTGTFSDGSHQALPIKASNLVYSTAYPAPSYAVNINYGGQTTYFYITIISQPTRIWVATPPTKVTYHVGDTLNIAGLVVLADSSYTTSEPITLSNISGFDSSHVGAETLTITYKGLTTSFQINVINPSVAVTGITLNETSHALTTSGGNTDNITATITPNNASDQNIIWVSSNPAFLTVSGCSTATSGICNATLTASVAGTYIVTAKTEDGGFTATDTITVTCNTRLCLVSAPAPQPNTQHPRLVSVSDVIETMI